MLLVSRRLWHLNLPAFVPLKSTSVLMTSWETSLATPLSISNHSEMLLFLLSSTYIFYFYPHSMNDDACGRHGWMGVTETTAQVTFTLPQHR